MGLLTKITNTTNNEKPCFSTFCKKYGFVHAGVFGIVDGMYVLTKASGLDAETILSSISSQDFWKGIITSNTTWNTFSYQQDNLSDFYQFFSTFFKSQIQSLHIMQFSSNKQSFIFIVAQLESEEKQVLPDITPSFIYELSQICVSQDTCADFEKNEQKISDGLSYAPATLLSISFSEMIHRIKKEQTISTLNLCEQTITTFFSEITNLMQKSFGESNIIAEMNNYEFHGVLFTNSKIDDLLLSHQFSQTMQPVYCNASPDAISVVTSDTTHSADVIRKFLSAE